MSLLIILSGIRRLNISAPKDFWQSENEEVSAKVLPKLKIAHVIGKAVWDQGGDIRDGKLVRKNDGPEEVEQLLTTMTKYGN